MVPNVSALRDLRQEAGLTQREFADLIEVPLNTFRMWDSGLRGVPAHSLSWATGRGIDGGAACTTPGRRYRTVWHRGGWRNGVRSKLLNLWTLSADPSPFVRIGGFPPTWGRGVITRWAHRQTTDASGGMRIPLTVVVRSAPW